MAVKIDYKLVGPGIKQSLSKALAKNAKDLAGALREETQGRTPVDTGNAKAGWLEPRKAFGGYVIKNDVSYIGILDKGRHMTSRGMRGSNQAPKGMTGPAISYIEKNYKFLK